MHRFQGELLRSPVIDYHSEDFTKNGERYDVIMDAQGNAPYSAIVEDAFRLVAPKTLVAELDRG